MDRQKSYQGLKADKTTKVSLIRFTAQVAECLGTTSFPNGHLADDGNSGK